MGNNRPQAQKMTTIDTNWTLLSGSEITCDAWRLYERSGTIDVLFFYGDTPGVDYTTVPAGQDHSEPVNSAIREGIWAKVASGTADIEFSSLGG